ncbi:MAG: sterol desaturase family protein [Candidatus Binatia bacterium]
MIETWILTHADNLQISLFFGFFVVFMVTERYIPKRPGVQQRTRRWSTNLLLTAFSLVVLFLLPVTFFGVAVWAQERGLGLLNCTPLPLGILIVGTLLARGFISFSTHYLVHKVPVFWTVHRVHHLDTELDVSSTVRFHPLEFPLNLLLGIPQVIFFGLTPWVQLVYEILDATITVFSHANIRMPRNADRFLRYLIVTPDLHRVHHSAWQPETNSNFGAVFPFWDLVCGTFHTDTRDSPETMELGLSEVRDARTEQIHWLLISPWVKVGWENEAMKMSGLQSNHLSRDCQPQLKRSARRWDTVRSHGSKGKSLIA